MGADPGQPSTSTLQQKIYMKKVLLYIWWDINGVLYYELLETYPTVIAERYALSPQSLQVFLAMVFLCCLINGVRTLKTMDNISRIDLIFIYFII